MMLAPAFKGLVAFLALICICSQPQAKASRLSVPDEYGKALLGRYQDLRNSNKDDLMGLLTSSGGGVLVPMDDALVFANTPKRDETRGSIFVKGRLHSAMHPKVDKGKELKALYSKIAQRFPFLLNQGLLGPDEDLTLDHLLTMTVFGQPRAG